ncbi:MAG: hypothetical protein QXS03_01985, partial [Candidatus Micrarchaeaceae archaeon]
LLFEPFFLFATILCQYAILFSFFLKNFGFWMVLPSDKAMKFFSPLLSHSTSAAGLKLFL